MSSAWPFGNLRPLYYGAILADPPWHFETRSEKGEQKSPQAHYQTMDDESLRRLPVAHLAAPDCFLVMWAIAPKLDFAIDLLKHWGFTYKTFGAWHKRTRYGKTQFGTGYILRSACEPYVIGTIGSPKVGSRSIRNIIDAPVRQHSRKPPDMRHMVEKMAPRAWRCELFAREPWTGNDVWGNEPTKFLEAA